jgi:exonuclease III
MTIFRNNDVDTGRDDGEVATIRIGTFNIRNGRAGNLESALRAMGKMDMDIVLFTETKLTGRQHTKESFGYEVVATEAPSKFQGAIALVYRQSQGRQLSTC